jgi:hypothetical protein
MIEYSGDARLGKYLQDFTQVQNHFAEDFHRNFQDWRNNAYCISGDTETEVLLSSIYK